MKNNYTIKNFRVFDSEGVNIKLNPLTLLTGCNSSGKSSIVKSLLLLCDYFSELKVDGENDKKISLTDHKLDFSKKPHNTLGRFSKVVNTNAKGNNITLGIQVHSLMLAQDVNLEFVFSIDEKDSSANGYINSITIKKIDGTIIYASDKTNNVSSDFYSIFPEFVNFVCIQHLISTYQSNEIARMTGLNRGGEVISDETYNKSVQDLKLYIDDFKNTFGTDSLRNINKWNNMHRQFGSFLSKFSKNKPGMMQKVKDNSVLYYLPIFDDKLAGDKKECIDFLTSCLTNEKVDKGTMIIVDKIISDFESSAFDDFLSYYRNAEKLYLSVFSPSYFLRSKNRPSIYSADRSFIDGTKIWMCPYNVKTHIVDISGEVTEIAADNDNKEKEDWKSQPLTFDFIFEALAILSEKFCSEDTMYFEGPNGWDCMAYYSKPEILFREFISAAVKEIVVEASPCMIDYVSSSIINVKRLYPLESNDEFTDLLKRYIEAKYNLTEESDYAPDTFLTKWIKAFGIGENISVDVDSEGLGITLRLHKNANDTKGMLLADNGYGITQLFAILLTIEVAIMERKTSKVIADNDMSASPYIEKMQTTFSTKTIAIEEPENHLHPRYQSILADMFVDAYKNYGINFIVETHSEYLIRKLQILVSGVDEELKISNKDVSLLYIYSPSESARLNVPQVKEIGICKDGYLNDSFGSGFFDEATSLSRQLM